MLSTSSNLYNIKHQKKNLYKNLLIIFFSWIMLEGILRKWIVPGLATPIFFLKYLIVIIVFLYFLIRRDKISSKLYPFFGLLFFFLFYCLLQLINLDYSGSIIVGVIGLTVYFGFVPLLIAIPSVVKNKQQLESILFIISILCLGIFILGIVQYFSPHDSFINKYVDDNMFIALVGKHPRIVTIFSYIGTYTAFLNFVLLLLLIQVINIKKLNFKNVLVIATLLLGIINIFMTGSRGPVGLFFIMAAMIISIYAISLQARKMVVYVFNFVILSFGMYFVITQTEAGATSLASFMDRVENSEGVGGRVEDAFNPFKYLDQAGLVGFGIGTTYQGAQSFIMSNIPLPPYEEESERLVLEIGLVGFIFIVLIRIWIFFYAIRIYRIMTDSFLKLIAIVIIVHQIPTVIVFNMTTFNWLENIIYWTEVGILVSLNIIAQNEKNQYTGVASI